MVLVPIVSYLHILLDDTIKTPDLQLDGFIDISISQVVVVLKLMIGHIFHIFEVLLFITKERKQKVLHLGRRYTLWCLGLLPEEASCTMLLIVEVFVLVVFFVKS